MRWILLAPLQTRPRAQLCLTLPGSPARPGGTALTWVSVCLCPLIRVIPDLPLLKAFQGLPPSHKAKAKCFQWLQSHRSICSQAVSSLQSQVEGQQAPRLLKSSPRDPDAGWVGPDNLHFHQVPGWRSCWSLTPMILLPCGCLVHLRPPVDHPSWCSSPCTVPSS